MAADRPGFRDWWLEIGSRYHVRANVGIDGQEYARFGTTFGNQIIVVDRDGQTTDEAAMITADRFSVREAFRLLEDLSREDVYGRVREASQQAGNGSTARNLRPGTAAGENPLLELMGLLLGDGFGAVQSPPTLPISSQQWLDWHHLALMKPEELTAAMNLVLEMERPELPTELTAMRLWAASLMLSTLDQLEMI